jgi:hypothetical protein
MAFQSRYYNDDSYFYNYDGRPNIDDYDPIVDGEPTADLSFDERIRKARKDMEHTMEVTEEFFKRDAEFNAREQFDSLIVDSIQELNDTIESAGWESDACYDIEELAEEMIYRRADNFLSKEMMSRMNITQAQRKEMMASIASTVKWEIDTAASHYMGVFIPHTNE